MVGILNIGTGDDTKDGDKLRNAGRKLNLMGAVIDRAVDAPAITPALGNLYIVPASATGDFAGQDNDLAYYNGSAWEFYTPVEGWRVWDANAKEMVFFTDGSWDNTIIPTPNYLGVYVDEAALNSAHATASPGNYAHIDAGASNDTQLWLWDDNDSAWVQATSSSLTGGDIVTLIDTELGGTDWQTGGGGGGGVSQTNVVKRTVIGTYDLSVNTLGTGNEINLNVSDYAWLEIELSDLTAAGNESLGIRVGVGSVDSGASDYRNWLHSDTLGQNDVTQDYMRFGADASSSQQTAFVQITGLNDDGVKTRLQGQFGGSGSVYSGFQYRDALQADDTLQILTRSGVDLTGGIIRVVGYSLVDVAASGGGGAAYDFRLTFTAAPGASEVLERVILPRDITLPANLGGAVGQVGTNPTAVFDIDVQDDGVSIGTISIATDGTYTFTTTSGEAKTVDAGSELEFIAPASVDATIADVDIGIPAETVGGLVPQPARTEEVAAATYSFVAADAGKRKKAMNASDGNWTIDASLFSVDDEVLIYQNGAGLPTFVAAVGTTIRSRGGVVTSAGQYALMGFKVESATEVSLFGDLA